MKKTMLFLSLLTMSAQMALAGVSRSIESITSNNVVIIKFGAAGKVWASTPGFGCAVYDSTSGIWTAFNPGNSPMKSDTITGIELYGISGTPNSFMATTNGVYYRHGTTWDSLPGLPDTYATGIIKSPDGKLYVSTLSGISVYKSDSLYHITDYTTGNSALPFAADIIALQFLEVNTAGFYAATSDSGYFYTGDGITYYKVNTGNSGLIDDRINCILISADTSKHYLGTKAGLSVYSSGSFTNYTTAQGLPENDVTSVAIDCNGNMWVGTRNSGIGIYNGTSFVYLNTTNVLPSNHITTINCKPYCQCWVGTADSGIVILDSSGNVQDVFTGVNEIPRLAGEMKIFPNPASTTVTVNYGFANWNAPDPVSLEIINELGQIVYNQPIPEYPNNIRIDVSRYATGIYTGYIRRNGQLIAEQRFAKE